ncbi:MAG: hypothetical protein K6F86_12530 [Lachnospiraceae bacterium]|nr:hypothetical protein [Lachnospiraceae bacterium]
MDKTRLFLIIQSVICILVVLMLSVSAIRIYRDGMARRAENPAESIYTRENFMAAAAPGMLTAFLGLGIAAACWILGIKDEKAEKPAADVDIDMKTGRIKTQLSGKNLQYARLAVLIIAAVFIIAGIINGNMYSILIKAINICTECIGLG